MKTDHRITISWFQDDDGVDDPVVTLPDGRQMFFKNDPTGSVTITISHNNISMYKETLDPRYA